MDVFRVGTLLEMVRDIAEALAEDGKGVKVCVQQAMGQGVFQVSPSPLPLLTYHPMLVYSLPAPQGQFCSASLGSGETEACC